jgi:hypothetical protein
MLKRIIINQKKVPVPVPILTLGEAVRWVEATLVPQGHTITRVALNDRVVGGEETQAATRLTVDSKLEIQIDSPVELAVQTLEAVRNLSSVVFSGLKPLAVECWQAKPVVRPNELPSTTNDLSLVLDLIDHIVSLVEPMDIDVAPIQGIALMLKRVSVSLSMASSSSDWKACARLLLNRLEPLLKDLMAESESIQMRVLAHTGFALAGEGRR